MGFRCALIDHNFTMSKNPLTCIIDNNKLTGPNYLDWLRNLKILLDSEDLRYILDAPIPPKLPSDAKDEDKTALAKFHKDDKISRCYMLASISFDLQRQHETIKHALKIYKHLKELYGENPRVVRYQISKELFRARMTEGTSVHDHVSKMIAVVEKLESNEVYLDHDLATNLILQSLPDYYDQFCD
ncbi:uncharacterized protein [Rutidosis leptorrhynchoides]|uniref:uncharacterized protein n=1 Tax=Rutidosis leptorrhynchoides TaxID=125765 RepID=UPI003A98EF60